MIHTLPPRSNAAVRWSPEATTLTAYVDALRASGTPVCEGSHGTYWIASSDRVLHRLPTCHVGAPSGSEVDHALRTTGGVVANYVTACRQPDTANSWLYLCSDRGYSLSLRPPAMRRNVSRALRELTITPLTLAELLEHGARAFCDTRYRNGLSDWAPRRFRWSLAALGHRPGVAYLGAWRNGQLAAFVTLLRTDDSAELGCFSATSMLQYRPNDALLYAAVLACMRQPTCRVVTYGVSSVEDDTWDTGLHRFKRKIGFEALAVRREFVLHPVLRRFAGRLTLSCAHWMVSKAVRARPGGHRLRKVAGMLSCMLRAMASTSPMPAPGSAVHHAGLTGDSVWIA